MTSARGHLVLVVGPSGAGKDTLIDYARARLQSDTDFHFVRRVITRSPSIGENHEPVSIAEFQCRANAGAFALHWQAYGFSYGIPSTVERQLCRGTVVVANSSRAIVPLARLRYPKLLVINVTVPVEVLSRRLVGRGRENASSRKQRLARSDIDLIEGRDVLRINNVGSLDVAGEQFIDALRACRPRRDDREHSLLPE
ncbi:phosphonate metabolism protein/1,5-bisphosphokinase (PRPP-forming) PhnN [Bradyrhizobium sp. Pear77]|uniref:phosphonate metabolism protein/1,5-bisphosphokinase (PRPP-forming) PhnN n=1 Tax=Bradyrhizobium altum TaxID=1571202 RepID=UPI001E44D03F|nr:phosphonate metabolism protein/1,5-bisphosphokinase (PRPP-forming) PhnN [Bradyrhizobium altum]MCC8957602.1 phosphonate metabolism protein/1,5-bisphosphokinase (PRPP-forming) PhnN [Bradyrhizobium altum]